MKVANARIYVVESGGIRPILLELTSDDGHTGLGEAAIAYGAGGTAAAAMIKELVDRYIVGQDPFRIEKLWCEMYDHCFWAKGGGPILFAAMSAIEIALVDIKARALRIPVYDLLGGKVQDKLHTYANGWYFGCTDNGQLPRFAENAVKDGYDALKFYPFATILETGKLRHPDRRAASTGKAARKAAVEIVRSVRDAVGPDVELMLDLTGGLTTDETIRFCRDIEQYDIAYVEEPAEALDPGALAKIAASISQPIAAGERVYTRYGFRDLLEARCVDILQPDIGNTGGLLEARKIAAMAEAYSIKVQPHVCASALSTVIGMHFSASLPNFYMQEHFPYWDRIAGYTEVLENPIEPEVKNGFIPVSDAPGLGVMLRRKAIDNSLFAECRLGR